MQELKLSCQNCLEQEKFRVWSEDFFDTIDVDPVDLEVMDATDTLEVQCGGCTRWTTLGKLRSRELLGYSRIDPPAGECTQDWIRILAGDE